MAKVEVRMPDIGLREETFRLTVWLAPPGTCIEHGEPILEATAGAVTIDLPAPAGGVLLEQLAAEDDLIKPGDPVAIIDTDV